MRGAAASGLCDDCRRTLEPTVNSPKDQPVLDALLDSWDRGNAVLLNLLRAIPRGIVATGLGYCYWPHQAHREHWFCKPSAAHRTHHLHLVPIGAPHWLRVIAFRDYLRTHPETAREYAALKERLAIEHRLDREAYTDAKRPFIVRITQLALREIDDHGHAPV